MIAVIEPSDSTVLRLMTTLAALVGAVALMHDGMGRVMAHGVRFGGRGGGGGSSRGGKKGGLGQLALVAVIGIVAIAIAVPVAANLAFEVLLAELRRQVQRRRGLPAPVALPALRAIRVVLAPGQTFRQPGPPPQP